MRLIKKIDDTYFNTSNLIDLLKHVSETFFEVIKTKICKHYVSFNSFLGKNTPIKKSIQIFYFKTLEIKKKSKIFR